MPRLPATLHNEKSSPALLLFQFLFGVAFFAGGVLGAIEFWPGLSQTRGADLTMIALVVLQPLLFGGLGFMFACGAVQQFRRRLRFGPGSAEVAETNLRPGDSFAFNYTQPCHKRVSVQSRALFLVWREQVSYRRSTSDRLYTEAKNIDRLVEAHTRDAHTYQPGEQVREEHSFTLPAHAMGIRNQLMHLDDAKVQTFWVVKVRLTIGRNDSIWQEFTIEVASDLHLAGASGAGALSGDGLMWPALPAAPGLCDVYLTSSPIRYLRIMPVLVELAPHLSDDQCVFILMNRPALLLENVSPGVAQDAVRRLEAAGAKAEIRRAGAADVIRDTPFAAAPTALQPVLPDQDARTRLQPLLEAGEELKWAGRPTPARAAQAMLPIAGMGFFVLVLSGSFRLLLQIPTFISDPATLLTSHILFDILPLAMGLVLLCLPLYAWWSAGRTLYGITNRRVIMAKMRPTRNVDSFAKGSWRLAPANVRADGSGDITFALQHDAHGRARAVKLLGIPAVRAVEQILRDTLEHTP